MPHGLLSLSLFMDESGEPCSVELNARVLDMPALLLCPRCDVREGSPLLVPLCGFETLSVSW